MPSIATPAGQSARGRGPVTVLVGTALAVALATLGIILADPAGADTVPAQLTLAGIAGPTAPTGGSQLAVKTGSAVQLTAAAAPTAGAPGPLGGALGGVPAGRIQVEILTSSLPNVHAPVKIGACAGASVTTAALPDGDYSLTYVVRSMNLLCSAGTEINLDGNQLKQAGVALNAKNQYVATISANSNPQTSVGVQVPQIGAQPQAGPITLPGVTLPGTSVNVGVPNAPNLPNVPSLLPGQSSSRAPAPGGGQTGSSNTGGYALQPELQGYPAIGGSGCCGLTIGQRGAGGGTGGSGAGAGGSAPGLAGATAPGGGPRQLSPGLSPGFNADLPGSGNSSSTLASSNGGSGASTPVLLGVLSILAFSIVAGSYARMLMLRRAG